MRRERKTPEEYQRVKDLEAAADRLLEQVRERAESDRPPPAPRTQRIKVTRKTRLTKWLTMREVADLMSPPDGPRLSPREVRSMLLSAQTRAGIPLMRKFGASRPTPWRTTLSLIARHAPELIDDEHQAAQAIRELRTEVLRRLDDVEAHARAIETETRRAFRNVDVRLSRIER